MPYLLIIVLLLIGSVSHAQQQPSAVKTVLSVNPSPMMLIAGKTVTLRFRLLRLHQMPITLNELKEVHTQKIHLLIIDPSLSDYHHIHPVEDNKTNTFVFNFTPKNNGSYRIWADITPLATGEQEFVMTDIGVSSKENIIIDKALSLSSIEGPYTFTLRLNSEPKAGQEIMATMTIKKNGKPFTQLEPLMGSFAHVVGFSADYSSILHIHPMGKDPRHASDRGGSKLEFHIKLKKPGFVKLFAQLRIEGKDIYVPFGIIVK
jgi:hypothetical protein